LSKLNKLSLKTPCDYLILMKLSIPTIGVLTTVVLLVSVGAIYAVNFESDMSLNKSASPSGAAYMVGNVKVTHFDQDGQVIGYRQGTNHITATGMTIIMAQVFQGINGSLPHQDNVTGTVAWMEVGTDGDASYANELRWNDTDIHAPVGGNCVRVQSTIANASLAHTSPNRCNFDSLLGWNGVQGRNDCAARMNVTAQADFTGANCAALDIDEAGIFTSSSAGAPPASGLMFARNTFGSVDLGALDTLQLQWEFTFKDTVP
jgi:hypothetical protein